MTSPNKVSSTFDASENSFPAIILNNKARIASILKAVNLDTSITGFPTFNLSKLKLPSTIDFALPTNVRLGHLAENTVSKLIKAANNYNLLYENVQVLEGNKTIGELDFIIEEKESKELIHLELAYKFYLFDPSISSQAIKNWIGPNRNDSLHEKLEKLKSKQFPLLYHPCTAARLNKVDVNSIAQSLCLLASLYVPFNYKQSLSPNFKQAIKGYYYDFETFMNQDNSKKIYYIPTKKQWGIHPSENKVWTDFSSVNNQITNNLNENRSVLCWQKEDSIYSEFFIVWW